MKRSWKYSINGSLRSWCVLLLAAVLATAAGCVKEFDPDRCDDPFELGPDDYALGFTLDLGTPYAATTDVTVAGTDIENYIDESSLRVLVFDKQGRFLFEASTADRWLADLSTSSGYNASVCKYGVVIKLNDYLNDANREATLRALQTDGFKIAVLANWRKAGNASVEFKYGESINRLHHCYADSFYATQKRSGAEILAPFVEDGKMGVYLQWVQNGNDTSSADGAVEYIRTKIGPDGSYEVKALDHPAFSVSYPAGSTIYTYTDLLKLWNFGDGNNASSILTYQNRAAGWVTGGTYNKALNDWFNQPSLTEITEESAQSTYGGLVFVPNAGTRAVAQVAGRNDRGVLLPAVVTAAESAAGEPVTEAYFTFKAPASGNLRIVASNTSGKQAQLVVHAGKMYEASKKDDNAAARSGFATNVTNTTPGYVVFGDNVAVTAGDVPVYLYCAGESGASVVVHEIEYISDTFFYESNRDMLLPGDVVSGEKLGIPMYGVQDFDGLGNMGSGVNEWNPGKIFDLYSGTYIDQTSDWRAQMKQLGAPSEGKYPTIYLLRALSRVDVWLPSEYVHEGQRSPLSVVSLRCINRFSRCEPMDVFTPTSQIWSGRNSEWANILAYGPFYYAQGTKNTASDYHTQVSWFFGNWVEQQWWDLSGISNMPKSPAYPQIFNPRINRSDYARMVKLNDNSRPGFDHYIAYVPEKSIDDPNSHGNLTNFPKVAHIEFRYGYQLTSNLDDDNHFRIYFANYNEGNRPPTWAELVSLPKEEKSNPGMCSGYEDYEQGPGPKSSPRNLYLISREHWPILRNHWYQFVASPADGSVQATMRPAGGGSEPRPMPDAPAPEVK